MKFHPHQISKHKVPSWFEDAAITEAKHATIEAARKAEARMSARMQQQEFGTAGGSMHATTSAGDTAKRSAGDRRMLMHRQQSERLASNHRATPSTGNSDVGGPHDDRRSMMRHQKSERTLLHNVFSLGSSSKQLFKQKSFRKRSEQQRESHVSSNNASPIELSLSSGGPKKKFTQECQAKLQSMFRHEPKENDGDCGYGTGTDESIDSGIKDNYVKPRRQRRFSITGVSSKQKRQDKLNARSEIDDCDDGYGSDESLDETSVKLRQPRIPKQIFKLISRDKVHHKKTCNESESVEGDYGYNTDESLDCEKQAAIAKPRRQRRFSLSTLSLSTLSRNNTSHSKNEVSLSDDIDYGYGIAEPDPPEYGKITEFTDDFVKRLAQHLRCF